MKLQMTLVSAALTALSALHLTVPRIEASPTNATEPAVVERTSFGWQAGDCVITTPLPEGYPAPTAPGAIEVKSYPSVRRAQVTTSANIDLGQNMSFWTLFRHIKDRDIAMTSPVEMEYHGWTGERRNPQSWTMAFLYRTADLGPTGRSGRVTILDSEPLTVVSIGLRGSYNMTSYQAALETLHEWLEGHPQWQAAGEARSLAYNGPDVRHFRRWSELQIPIEPVVLSEAHGGAEMESNDAAGA